MRFGMHIFMAVVLGIILSAAEAPAHHLWMAKEADGYAVCRGMIGDRVDPYDPARVSRVWAYDAGGLEITVRRSDATDRVMVFTDADPAILAVECAWGHRVNTTQGKKLMDRTQAEAQGLRVLSAFSSTQYAKTVLAPCPAVTKPLGLKLEIVPEQDPLSGAAAKKHLPVRLLFNGAPLTEIEIYTRDDLKILTDAEGRAVLPVDGKGSFLFYARHKIPAEPSDALDYFLFTTFFIFEVK